MLCSSLLTHSGICGCGARCSIEIMNPLPLRRVFLYFAAALVLASGGWSAHDWYHNHYDAQTLRRVKAEGFLFTSPLLDVELPEGFKVDREPIPFKYKVNEFVQRQINSG